MNKNKKVWISGISLLLALLLFAVLLTIQQSMKEEPESVWVFSTKADIPKHIVLTKENINSYVEKSDIPVMWLPEGYISSEEALYGMMAQTNIPKGSILCEAAFQVYEQYYADYEELHWISVPIQELYEGVAGSLRSGDFIDIYILKEEEEIYQCELLQERVLVAETYTSQGTGIETDSEDGLCQLIVIPIEKQNTAAFYEQLAKGSIRIAKYE